MAATQSARLQLAGDRLPSEVTSGDPAERQLFLLAAAPPLGDMCTTASPFVGKMELALRIAGIKYEGVLSQEDEKHDAPKHKVRGRMSHKCMVMQLTTDLVSMLCACVHACHMMPCMLHCAMQLTAGTSGSCSVHACLAPQLTTVLGHCPCPACCSCWLGKLCHCNRGRCSPQDDPHHVTQ